MKTWLFPALLATLSACTTASENTMAMTTLERTWQIVEIDGEAAQGTLSLDGADHSFSANLGCNTLFGDYEVDGNNIRFSEPAGTLMACEASLMQRDEKFTQSLKRSSTWQQQDGMLIIEDNSGNTLIKLK